MSAATEVRQRDQRPAARVEVRDVASDYEFQFQPTPAWKRAIDIVLGSVLLIGLSPVLLAIGLYIRCVSRGPVIFIQSRVGAGGRRFLMWKFRTMNTETDQNEHINYVASLAGSSAPLQKMDHRSRYIFGAGWLRALSLDELPQLVNVLRGEMSLIGPRPDVLDVAKYAPWQRRRFDVVPGITGLWQVSGKNRLTFEEMLELDVRYVELRSPWLDTAILLKTIPVVLRLNVG